MTGLTRRISDRLGPANRAFLLALWAAAAAAALSKMSLNPVWRRDFINYWLAPRAWWEGVNPYDVEAYRAFGLSLFAGADPHQFNFTYPPHALFLFAPFSVGSPLAGFVLWNLASLALFYLAARPLLPKGFPVLVALLTPAALLNFDFGQTGLLSAALFLLAFRGSGAAAALLTFKPHMGFLAAPALLERRRSLVLAVCGSALLFAASAMLFGGWADFLDHALIFQGGNLAAGTEYVWVRMAVTPYVGYGWIGWAVYGAAAAFLLSHNFNLFTAATATFLISPYGLHYDMAAACLGFALTLYVHWDRMPAWQIAVLSLAFLSPVVVDWGTWLIPPILLLALLVQCEWLEGRRLTFRRAAGRGLPRLALARVNGEKHSARLN